MFSETPQPKPKMAHENYQAAMAGLCVDGEHADFRVVVGEEVILVHRLIVSIR